MIYKVIQILFLLHLAFFRAMNVNNPDVFDVFQCALQNHPDAPKNPRERFRCRLTPEATTWSVFEHGASFRRKKNGRLTGGRWNYYPPMTAGALSCTQKREST